MAAILPLRCGLVLILGMWLGGCAAFLQPTDRVLIRKPGKWRYDPKEGVHVAESAGQLREYAILSSNVYKGSFQNPSERAEQLTREESRQLARGKSREDNLSPEVEECLANPPAPDQHWVQWPNFPSECLRERAEKLGLYMEVWESPGPPRQIVVVFKGTEFNSFPDWFSNLRWFNRLARFLPDYQDQYTLLSRFFGEEFAAKLSKDEEASGSGPIQLVATGHSLGGGLAQHFAYSLPKIVTRSGVEVRVSHVYAFDSSPVTGWYSVKKDVRERNAQGLEIDRVFEHGEILAYIRLLLSLFYPPSGRNPAVSEIRYNFTRTANIISSHSMARLACELTVAQRAKESSAEN